MTVSANRDSKRHPRPPVLSAAARVRSAGEDFSGSFVELRYAVSTSCGRQVEWEAKLIAGIRALLEFVAADPAKGEALTVKARRPGPGGRSLDQEVIDYFAELLSEVAPAEMRHPISTVESIVESIAALVRGHLIGRTADQLPKAEPDVVFLVLMPYLGLSGTRRWVEMSEPLQP